MVIKNSDDKFESFDEFLDYLKRGGELNFVYNNREYGVFKQNGKYFISELGDSQESVYEEPKDMYFYPVENGKLGEIITVVDVFNRLF